METRIIFFMVRVMGLFSGIASIAGAFLGANAAKDAADTQAQAAENATSEQRRQYDQTRQDQMPFYNTGVGGNQQLAYLLGINQSPYKQNGKDVDPYANINKSMGDFGSLSQSFSSKNFDQDPSYQFRLQEGQKALERSAAARGMLNSGAAAKAITNYAQGAASQEYQNAYNRYNANQTNLYNRLAGISGAGQSSANTLANYGQQTANNISSNIIGAGNAQAAGNIGAANAWSTGLNNLMGSFDSFGGGRGTTIPTTGNYAPWGTPWQR